MVRIIPYDEISSTFYEDRVENLFYSAAWLQVLQQTYDYQWFTAIDTRTEQFVLFTVVNNLASKKVVSLPFSDYTPINTGNRESAVSIAQHLRQRYPEYRIIFKTELSEDDPGTVSLGLPTRRAYYHRIPTDDPDQISYSSSFQRGVKKAKKVGITVDICLKETGLRAFYEMYYRLRLEKFGSIPQPYEFFQNIYQAFIVTDQGFILQASREGKVIASILVLRHRNILYYKFGSSDSTALEYRPNNLLFHHLIEIAVERKCTAIDLGLSGAGSAYEGLVRFKESMGGIRHPITYFTLTPEGYDEKPEKELKTMLSSLTQIMVDQQLNVETTSQLSSIIYPYFA